MLPEQQQRIMGYFIEEAKDHLNTIERGLLSLQATIEDPEMANEVFRAAHSVKGGAAMLGLESIQRTSHRMEDYFKVLKESPVQADRTLESMFLQVFDALQEQLEQLQGPFGLTDDKAEEIMAGVEPVFDQLEAHLDGLVQAAGGADHSTPQPTPTPAAVVSQRSGEDSALQLVFKSDVSSYLRDMLGLFKQADTASNRQALQDICHQLAGFGEQFELTAWVDLVVMARSAIANPENDYRTLAPILIKEIKGAQELVLAGRAPEIQVSDKLQSLVPEDTSPTDLDLADLALDDLEPASSTNDVSADELFGDSPELAVDNLDGLDLSSSDAGESAGEGFDDLFTDTASDDLDRLEDSTVSSDLGLDDLDDLSDFSQGDLGGTDLSLDADSLEGLMGSGAEPTGPEVGAAELNSLADLFEGDLGDLDDAWQEEDEASESASGDVPDVDISSDFADLLDTAESDSGSTLDSGDELADLFGEVLDDTPENEVDAPVLNLDELADSETPAVDLATEDAPDLLDSELDGLDLGGDEGDAASDDLALDALLDASTLDLAADPNVEAAESSSSNGEDLSLFDDLKPNETPSPAVDAALDFGDSLKDNLGNLDELTTSGSDLADLTASDSSANESELVLGDELSELSFEDTDNDATDSLQLGDELFGETTDETGLDDLLVATQSETDTETDDGFNIEFDAAPNDLAEGPFADELDLTLADELSDADSITSLETADVDLELDGLELGATEDTAADLDDSSLSADDTPAMDAGDSLGDLFGAVEDNADLAGDLSLDLDSPAEDVSEDAFGLDATDPSESDLEKDESDVESGQAYLTLGPDSDMDGFLSEAIGASDEVSSVNVASNSIDDFFDIGVDSSEQNVDSNFWSDPTSVTSGTDPVAGTSPPDALSDGSIADDDELTASAAGNLDDLMADNQPGGLEADLWSDVTSSEGDGDGLENLSEALDGLTDLPSDDSDELNLDALDLNSSSAEDEAKPAEGETEGVLSDDLWDDTSLDSLGDDASGDSAISAGEGISVADPSDLADDLNLLDNADDLDGLDDLGLETLPVTDSDTSIALDEDGTTALDSLLDDAAADDDLFAEVDDAASSGDGLSNELDDLLNDRPPSDDVDDSLDTLLDDVSSEEAPSRIDTFAAEPAADESAGFDELDALLDEPDAEDEASAASADFSDLEALLANDDGDTAPDVENTDGGVPSGGNADGDEFEDLEKLLEEADQTLGGPPGASSNRRTASAPSRLAARRPSGVLSEQTMRVSVKHLDNLSNLVGELVVNRNTLEQDQERLRQFLDNLLFQVQQLNDVGQRMRDLYERSLLESSLISSRQSYQMAGAAVESGSTSSPSHATGETFDALEMDRFTGFHTLSQEMIELIVRVRESASDIAYTVESADQVTRQFRQVTTQLQEGLNKARMVPFAQTADRLPRAVRDISLKCGKEARLVVEGRDTLIDKMILEQLYDPMTHLVNNAITHGIESPDAREAAGKPREGSITVRAFYQGNQTVIYVADDGGGIDPDLVKRKAVQRKLVSQAEARSMSVLDVYELLFHPGFSTRDQADDFAGRGVGMDVVRTSLAEIRGSITIDSEMGKGTSFTIRLPLTLSISKALSCISNQARIAFPMDGVEDMFDVPRERIQENEQGEQCILWRDTLLPFQQLTDLLKFNRTLGRGRVYGGHQDDDVISIVVLRSANTYIALEVDQVIGEQEIVIKQLEGPVPKPTGIAGATVLGDGRVMPIADVLELIDLAMGRVRRDPTAAAWAQVVEAPPEDQASGKSEPTVLIVDDSITVRELLSMSFNKVGYRVEQARDGQEAWEKMRSGLPCDLVFCDIEMPRMDGLELLSRMQKDNSLKRIPIAMLTSRGADRHRQMAVDLGASGYFTKPYLEEALLDAAQKMLNGESMVK